jgi:hypothetical protein
MLKQLVRRWRRTLVAALLSLCWGQSALGEEAFIIGVDTHLMNNDGASAHVLKLLEDAGIGSIRDDAYWARVEPRRGVLQIPPNWQSYLSNVREHRLRPLLVLGYGNPFYDNYAKPRHPAMRQAFGNYANFVAKELSDSVDLYEVWNEWDRENPIDAWAAKDYSNLVEDTVAHLRQAERPLTVLAGAVTSLGMDLGFADRLVQNGTLNQVDGLSLHPYVHCRQDQRHTPERWITWLRWINADLRALATRPVPMYLTEMGWPTSTGKCGISERTQAAFLVRSLFLARTVPDIKGLWWSTLSDSGSDSNDPQQNFGLLRQDLSAKPSFMALKAVSATVRDYEYDARKSRELDTTYLLRFARGSDQVLVAWTTGQPALTHVEATSVQRGNVQMIDTGQPERGLLDTGIAWTCNDARCSAQVPIDEFPKIISLGTRPALFAIQQGPRP